MRIYSEINFSQQKKKITVNPVNQYQWNQNDNIMKKHHPLFIMTKTIKGSTLLNFIFFYFEIVKSSSALYIYFYFWSELKL